MTRQSLGKTEQSVATLLIASRQQGKTVETISEFPDRLCIEQNSKFFSTSCPHVGVKIDGVEQNDIIEFCSSGRWVRVGERSLDGSLVRTRTGFETTTKWDVDIEVYWRLQPSRQVRRALKRVGA